MQKDGEVWLVIIDDSEPCFAVVQGDVVHTFGDEQGWKVDRVQFIRKIADKDGGKVKRQS